MLIPHSRQLLAKTATLSYRIRLRARPRPCARPGFAALRLGSAEVGATPTPRNHSATIVLTAYRTSKTRYAMPCR